MWLAYVRDKSVVNIFKLLFVSLKLLQIIVSVTTSLMFCVLWSVSVLFNTSLSRLCWLLLSCKWTVCYFR